jgi:secreted trypsin-like serine protease
LLAFRGQSSTAIDMQLLSNDCSAATEAEPCVPTDTLVIRNKLPTLQHVALVRIDQHSLRFVAAQNRVAQFTLNPGASRSYADQRNGQHIAIISSDQPLDLNMLASRDGRMADIPQAWNISVLSTPTRKSYMGGGGKAVASLFAAPWQVQLYSTDSNTPASLRASAALGKVAWAQHEKTHRCGGSVIGQDGDRYIVLTAAHCVAGEPFAGPVLSQNALKYRRVKLGTLNLRYGGTTYAIDSIVVHKDYKAGSQLNDIALLRIKPDSSTLAQNAKSVRSITPAARPPAASVRVKWYGWGFMEETEGHVARITSNNVVQRNPAELHEGEMQLIDRQTCSKRAGYGKVTDFMLCAVTPSDSAAARRGEHVFTCQGDSGGPITGIEGGKTVQVGIVSWAVGCGAKDNPSVSVNVAKYQSWINIAKTKFEAGKSVTHPLR